MRYVLVLTVILICVLSGYASAFVTPKDAARMGYKVIYTEPRLDQKNTSSPSEGMNSTLEAQHKIMPASVQNGEVRQDDGNSKPKE